MNKPTPQCETAVQAKKRRFSRVSRACVECRIRKVRCNGQQPCKPCEESSRRCIYSSTKAQRTVGAPRTKILEDRLRRAQALIAQLQAENPSVRHRAEINAIFDTPPGSPDSASETSQDADEFQPYGALAGDLENMMDGQGRYTAADDNNLAYFGGPSGFAFLQKTQDLFVDGNDNIPDQRSEPPSPQQLAFCHLFDSPLPAKQALSSKVAIDQLLPTRAVATRLLMVVFDQAYQLLQFLDESWFHTQVNRIYQLDPQDYVDSDHEFLPLFIGVVAVGYLFDPQRHKSFGCRRTIDQAMRHFIAARQMIDVTRCHDLVSLQTILIFSLFLMSTARLATAHTYVALAAAAAMRMGLHSQTTHKHFCPRENAARRTVFWTIVKLDIYIGTILGLPSLVDLSHVDQIRPCGSLDGYESIERDELVTLDKRRMYAASAQYRELLFIIAGLVQRLYPKTEHEAKQVRKSRKMLISSAVITEVEKQFKTWRDNLPVALGINDDMDPPALTKTLFELEVAHNLGHILLYRPFLHYLARSSDQAPGDVRQLRCASACIKTSRQTIIRSHEMLQQGYLAPAAWQIMYTIFLSIVALIFYLATQKGSRDYLEIEQEARMGIRILASTSCQDIGSRRCLDVLKVLARRLEDIVQLDIEAIEVQTVRFCQSEITVPVPVLAQNTTTPVLSPNGSDLIYEEVPYQTHTLDRMNQHQHIPQPPTPGSHADSFMHAQLMHPTPMSLSMHHATQNIQPFPSGQSAMMQQRMAASTADAMFRDNTTMGGMGGESLMNSYTSAYQHHPVDMEVSFSEISAWPFDPVGIGQLMNGVPMDRADTGATGVSVQLSPNDSPLTSDDIAALIMRINPGERPFL